MRLMMFVSLCRRTTTTTTPTLLPPPLAGHRAHHRYVDTDKDPYAAIKGFWYAHIGWMLVKTEHESIGHVDIKGAFA